MCSIFKKNGIITWLFIRTTLDNPTLYLPKYIVIALEFGFLLFMSVVSTMNFLKKIELFCGIYECNPRLEFNPFWCGDGCGCGESHHFNKSANVRHSLDLRKLALLSLLSLLSRIDPSPLTVSVSVKASIIRILYVLSSMYCLFV